MFTDRKSLEDYIVSLVRNYATESNGSVNIRWIEVRVALLYSPRDLITKAPNTAELQEIVDELIDRGELAYDECFGICANLMSKDRVAKYILTHYGKPISWLDIC